MQWSKLKSRLRSFVCPELRDRLDFHITSYRKSHDGVDRFWITLDGEIVFECKHYDFEFAEREGALIGKTGEDLTRWLGEQEIFSPRFAVSSMREYLDAPIEESLNSENPFRRAFAMIDVRVGKRTVELLHVRESDHSLIRAFYALRLSLIAG